MRAAEIVQCERREGGFERMRRVGGDWITVEKLVKAREADECVLERMLQLARVWGCAPPWTLLLSLLPPTLSSHPALPLSALEAATRNRAVEGSSPASLWLNLLLCRYAAGEWDEECALISPSWLRVWCVGLGVSCVGARAASLASLQGMGAAEMCVIVGVWARASLHLALLLSPLLHSWKFLLSSPHLEPQHCCDSHCSNLCSPLAHALHALLDAILEPAL